MVIRRKPMKTDRWIKDESIEQVDSFKYLGCNINSTWTAQEVMQRIAMAKEAFNRKRSIFCRSLEKELRKRPVKCFLCVECSVVRCRDLATTMEWAKTTGSIWYVDMEKDGACKMDKIKNAVMLERVEEERKMLELIKRRKRNWLGHWLRMLSLQWKICPWAEHYDW